MKYHGFTICKFCAVFAIVKNGKLFDTAANIHQAKWLVETFHIGK